MLLTDLHMPNPGDGFTVITAMRHCQPEALTLLMSGYPDVQTAMSTILLEADKIVVKPFDGRNFAEFVRIALLDQRPAPCLRKEKVAVVLQRSVAIIAAAWLLRSKQVDALNSLHLPDEQRMGHLPKLVEDLAFRLSLSTSMIRENAQDSPSAAAHGEVRFLQGYTPAMLVQESRILQVTIFETLQNNRDFLDFSLLLPDVMTIADEVDSQLTQSMNGFMKAMARREDVN